MLPNQFSKLMKKYNMKLLCSDIHCCKLGSKIATVYFPFSTPMVKNILIVTCPHISTESETTLKTLALLHGFTIRT